MIFLGFLFDKSRFENYQRNIKSGWFQAGSVFQWNIIDGFIENGYTNFKIVNFAPVGAWPSAYKKLTLPSVKWNYKGIECFELGGINVPYLKQKQREIKLYNFLKKQKDGEEIFMFSPNLIFLNVLNRLKKKKNFKITLLITDIPEFYDMSNKKKSLIRKYIANKSNELLHIADNYILLTDQMAEYLKITKPYLVLESIVNPGESFVGDNSESNEKIIFYSGLLHKKFGIENLLNAFIQMKNENYRLYLCGDGDCKEKIIELSEKDKRIVYFGNIDRSKVLELQKQSTVLVNPRQNIDAFVKFSFPSKTVEYMLNAKPVVMYKLDGIPDEYDDYLCYVDNNTVEALRDKLNEVINWPQGKRDSFGQSARDFVVKNKNRKIQTKKVLDFILK